MPNMSFYKEKQNQGVSTTKQPTSQPTFTTGPLILNPFAKRSGGLGGLEGIGPIGPINPFPITPFNILPFRGSYSAPTLPPTKPPTTTTTTPPPINPILRRGIQLPPQFALTIHGIPTLPPSTGTTNSTTTTTTTTPTPKPPSENPNADYGVLGSILLMLLPFIL
ncbi:MAG: hypothetical protein QXP36_07635, partial [Conexivisphaerales archaeon]